MHRKDKKFGDLNLVQLGGLLKALVRQTKATKKLYFRHRGVVVETRDVPDHRAQLNALAEIVRLYGLLPRRGEREVGDRYDRSERPVINLVVKKLR